MSKKSNKREQLMKKFNAIGNEVYPHTDNYFKLSEPVALCADGFFNKRIAVIDAVDVDSFIVWVRNRHKRSVYLPISILNLSVLGQVVRQMEKDAIDITK